MKERVRKNCFISALNVIAMAIAIVSVNTLCLWIMGQPDVPDTMKIYKYDK